jgi:hypothetical protein
MYYAEEQKLQLMLPLCLTSDKPEVVIVLSKESESVYRGNTTLDMKSAYKNARLIAKPEGWFFT